MENTNLVVDMEQAYDESLEKIFQLLEEKKYFKCRDELHCSNMTKSRSLKCWLI